MYNTKPISLYILLKDPRTLPSTQIIQ